ncbi:hypothetical protein LDC_2409 [sediment metagenome]|uniref:Uncharacterized protein n=1 Tax=sediment metagenome TaxID=749907 RepID=D9PLI6_9ZZZZ
MGDRDAEHGRRGARENGSRVQQQSVVTDSIAFAMPNEFGVQSLRLILKKFSHFHILTPVLAP